jgi:hypothetical protein
MSEKFGFGQSLRESSAVYGDKGSIHPRAMLLQGCSEHLLACPRLTNDEDGHICRCHHAGAAEQGFEIGRLTNQLLKHSHFKEISMCHRVLNHGVESRERRHQRK